MAPVTYTKDTDIYEVLKKTKKRYLVNNCIVISVITEVPVLQCTKV